MLVSRQKIRVHEGIYLEPLSVQPKINDSEFGSDNEKLFLDSEVSVPSSNSFFDQISSKPETDNNMVQSVKSLQNHKQKLVGTSHGKMSDIEESAMYGNPNHFHEGIYTDSIVISDAERLTLEVEEEVKRGTSMKDALLKAIRKNSKVVQNGALARGKNQKATGDVTDANIIASKRKRQKNLRFDRVRKPACQNLGTSS